MTKTEKPRVVYDCAARVDDISFNWAVLDGKNLLNNLLQVLLRFYLISCAFVVVILWML